MKNKLLKIQQNLRNAINGPTPFGSSQSAELDLATLRALAAMDELLAQPESWEEVAAHAETLLPEGWAIVVVPKGPPTAEPDWDDVKEQVEETTGLQMDPCLFNIVVREVRRWIFSHQK